MIHLPLLLGAGVPATVAWSPTVGIVMVICNVIAIFFTKATVPGPYEGGELPMPELFGGMRMPQLLASTSLGHIIGMGTILGLANMGMI
jgi:photosystem I subunit 10